MTYEGRSLSFAVGNCLLKKEDQNPALKRDYANAFQPD